MERLPQYMGISMLVLTLLVLGIVYQTAGIRWKTRPWIPLTVGILILLSAYFTTLAINRQTKVVNAVAEQMAKQSKYEEQEIWKTFAEANDYQAKLLELVTIPLAVSIVAAALFARADHAFQTKIIEHEERQGALDHREAILAEETDSLIKDLTAGVRGQGVIDRRERISAERRAIVNGRLDLRHDYSDLIDARLVRQSNARR